MCACFGIKDYIKGVSCFQPFRNNKKKQYDNCSWIIVSYKVSVTSTFISASAPVSQPGSLIPTEVPTSCGVLASSVCQAGASGDDGK